MNIRSATFVKGAVGTDAIFTDGKPQIAFIGRSNAGKSTLINSLTGKPGLARTSSSPGKTLEMNVFLINKDTYLVDLPGYGFARKSREEREKLEKMINWYLFKSPYVQKKVVLIIDANIGPTDVDLEMLLALREHNKDFVVVANKVDKIKPSKYDEQMNKNKALLGGCNIILYSSQKKIGVADLTDEILS